MDMVCPTKDDPRSGWKIVQVALREDNNCRNQEAKLDQGIRAHHQSQRILYTHLSKLH